jgi:hypothetical protein
MARHPTLGLARVAPPPRRVRERQIEPLALGLDLPEAAQKCGDSRNMWRLDESGRGLPRSARGATERRQAQYSDEQHVRGQRARQLAGARGCSGWLRDERACAQTKVNHSG